jgi:hypothetical protein
MGNSASGTDMVHDAILSQYAPSIRDEKAAKGSYELLRALSTNCDLIPEDCRMTKNFIDGTFDQALVHDIKFIVRRFPEAVHTELGCTRMRSALTPLHIAILNEQVPFYLIPWLLDNGAHPNLFYNTSSMERIHLFDDIHHIVSHDRRKIMEYVLLQHPEYIKPKSVLN